MLSRNGAGRQAREIRVMRTMTRRAVGFMVGMLLAAGSPSWAQAALQAPPPAKETRAVKPTVTAPAPAPATPVAAAPVDMQGGPDAGQVRDRFRDVLQRVPPAVSEVLRLDPGLLTAPDYLAPYPELGAYIAAHPEIARNPSFYVGSARDQEWDRDPRRESMRMWEDVLQGIFILTIFLCVIGVLVWLIRTLIDYRRWLRLTRVQTETHTKLLDRITSNEDMLSYMGTPAGRRFLESAPIALDAASRPLGAPLSRILWSVQAGVVLALGGVGMLVISQRSAAEVTEPVMAVGILALALGAGFIASAAIAWLLSSRLGLLDARSTSAAEPPSGSGLSR